MLDEEEAVRGREVWMEREKEPLLLQLLGHGVLARSLWKELSHEHGWSLPHVDAGCQQLLLDDLQEVIIDPNRQAGECGIGRSKRPRRVYVSNVLKPGDDASSMVAAHLAELVEASNDMEEGGDNAS